MSIVPQTTDAIEEQAPRIEIEDAFEILDNINGWLARFQPQVNAAIAKRAEIEAVIAQRMAEAGARRYEGERYRAKYETRKVGSASIPLAAGLRSELLQRREVPVDVIEAALPLVVAPPTVNPDLRKVRKIAEFGNTISAIISRHIVEARQVDVLVIEPVEKNVTGKTLEELADGN